MLICTKIRAINSICLHLILTRLQRPNRLAAMFGAEPDWAKKIHKGLVNIEYRPIVIDHRKTKIPIFRRKVPEC